MPNINSDILRNLYVSGANNLSNNFKEVDSLNVFPIPDGDTGTNMMMTIQSGIKNIESLDSVNCGEIATSFSKGLLLGARGNSGVILSQIFRGFAEAIKEKNEEFTVADLSAAFTRGKERAYRAVLKPTEGTILTVIKESSTELASYIESNPDATLTDALKVMLDKAKETLANTPNLLPVLKEANVVDSGGAGLVKIIEGFYEAANGNIIASKAEEETNEEVKEEVPAEEKEAENEGYAVDFTLKVSEDISDPEEFKAAVEDMVSSISVKIEGDLLKAKAVSATPGELVTALAAIGEIVTVKITNAKEAPAKAKKAERKQQAIVTVAVGAGLTRLFKQLGADIIISGGQTMNPSIEDFVKAITKLNPESVIILPNNSNIIMSAKQAADILGNNGIVCKIVPTTSIQQGISACMGFNPDIGLEENFMEMVSAFKRVTCGQITTAVRDARLNGVSIHSGDYIGIKEKKIISSSRDLNRVAVSLVNAMMTYDAEVVTIIAGCDVTKKTVKTLEKYIRDNYPHVDVEIQQGDQPVYQLLLAVE